MCEKYVKMFIKRCDYSESKVPSNMNLNNFFDNDADCSAPWLKESVNANFLAAW